jgi:hypothetical protein
VVPALGEPTSINSLYLDAQTTALIAPAWSEFSQSETPLRRASRQCAAA